MIVAAAASSSESADPQPHLPRRFAADGGVLAEHQMSHLRLGCVSTTCLRTRECRGASAEASGASSGCLFPPTIAETEKERGESRPDLICK